MTQLEFHDKFQTDEEMFVWVNEAEEKIAKLEATDKIKNCEECYEKVIKVFKLRGIE